MDFNENGWLKKYLNIRNNQILQREYQRISAQAISEKGIEQVMYQFVKPTGLMYGHPVEVPFKYKSLSRILKVDNLNNADKVKIVLVECFLNSALASPRYKGIHNEIDLADAILEATINIGKFYKFLYPKTNTKKGSIFRTERGGLDLTEFIISEKISKDIGVGTNFWNNVFQSSLMFIDVIYFGAWLHLDKSKQDAAAIRNERDTLRLAMLKVIAATSYADQVVDLQEKKLFAYFLESVELPEGLEAEALRILEHGLQLKDLSFSEVTSHFLKRYLLELAILTTCIDDEISPNEISFLKALSHKLGISKNELEESTLSVESFMVEHWHKVYYVQRNHNYQSLSDHLIILLQKAVKQNEKFLLHHIKDNSELAALLVNMKNDSLSTEKKKLLRKLLLEVLQLAPVFQTTILPKTFLSLSVISQIVPDSFMLVGQNVK